MNKPDDVPTAIWDEMGENERQCACYGHNWYYDTCEHCGARRDTHVSMRTNIHLPSEEEYRQQKNKLAR